MPDMILEIIQKAMGDFSFLNISGANLTDIDEIKE